MNDMQLLDRVSIALTVTILILSGSPALTWPADIELRVQQVSPAPLPYQPALLRLEVVNRGAGALRLEYPEAHKYRLIFGARRNPLDDWQNAEGSISSQECNPTEALDRWEFEDPLTLQPGEAVSLKFAVAGLHRRNGFEPFVLRTGKCFLLFKYYPAGWAAADEPVSREIELRPATVEKEEHPVLDWLERERTARTVMLSLLHPVPDEVVSSLHELIDRFPKSSYVPYARFALARWCARPMYIAEEQRYAPTDLAGALKELEQISVAKFAFGAEVLVFDRTLQRHDFDRLPVRKKLAERLDELFPDSLERLNDLSFRVRSAAEWKELNPRKPYKFVDKAAGSL